VRGSDAGGKYDPDLFSIAGHYAVKVTIKTWGMADGLQGEHGFVIV
jgi:hypothetical protein